MIRLIKNGNIFESDCEAWVNPVNCVGVMGAGLAKAFKNNFPDYYKDYKVLCKNYLYEGGDVWYYKHDDPWPKWILSFATKNHWKESSKIEYVKKGIFSLKNTIETLRIKSIAIPALGCGLGRLAWEDVLPIIEFLDSEDIIIEIYEPKGGK